MEHHKNTQAEQSINENHLDHQSKEMIHTNTHHDKNREMGMEHSPHGSTQVQHEDHSKHKGHENHENHHEMMIEDFKRRFYISMWFSLPVIVLSPIVQELLGYNLRFSGMEYILLGLSTFIYLYGGIPFFKGFKEEMEKLQPGMMTLVALAISVSYIYSAAVVVVLSDGKFFFWELATLIDIMLLGHWIEMRSVLGASRALKELAELIPSETHLVMNHNGEEHIKDIPTAQLNPGDVVLIKPGESIPADGTIIKGSTAVNESAITGESRPVTKREGDSLIGGSVNGSGSLRLRIDKTGKESYLQQVMDMVNEAQKTRSKAQDLANRAAFYLTIIAVVAGLGTFFIWILLGQSWTFALERMVTVMVITCPHALGLAVPLVVSTSTSLSAKNGVLIRDRQSFERSRNVDKIIFDKTGTLTTGNFGVSEVLSFSQLDQNEILQLIASLESESEHSIAKAIVDYAKQSAVNFQSIDGFAAIPGIGIKGSINNTEYKVVSPRFLDEKDIEIDREHIEELHEQGKTVVVLIQGDQTLGALALSDIIRENSKETISELKKRGIEPIMLTGDNKKVAAHVSKELGIETYYAEVLPDQKADIVSRVKSDGSIVAMVGDGVNDAPALVTADVGYAIAAGTDVAIESADIVLVKDNPKDILNALILSRKTYGKMEQNLAWATGYNFVAIPLAAGILYNLGILLSPAIGGALMSLSTVIVAINAKLLRMG